MYLNNADMYAVWLQIKLMFVPTGSKFRMHLRTHHGTPQYYSGFKQNSVCFESILK